MKTILCSVFALASMVMFAADTGNRQHTDNAKSPPMSTSATLNGHSVTIEYNAPSVRGRKVEGGLVPYGQVWRLGADAATTLTTDTDLMIGNLKVPKGVYTLYIAADASAWMLVVNKQTHQWGTEYNKPQDLGRVKMATTKLSSPVEELKINLDGSGSSATLDIEWGNTKATVPVKAS